MFVLLLYRNCNELRFCAENINNTHKRISIKAGTQNLKRNLYSADLLLDDDETEFKLNIYKIKDSGFRFRIDPGQNLSNYRFDINLDDIIVNKSKITTYEDIKVEYFKSYDIIHAQNEIDAYINFNPLTITFARNDKYYLTINSENFLFIEDGEKLDNTEFQRFTETYPHGKTAVGIDVSFMSPKARITGFSEGTYPANLEDTESNPERRYSRDSYAMYGFIPLLTGHCAEFDSISPTIFWINPSDMFIKIITKSTSRVASLISEGGFIDLIIFIDSMPNVLRDYSYITGRAPLPPAFSFGYHQSKYGYKSQQEVQNILDKMNEIGFPHDVIWLDIDHLHNFSPLWVNRTWFPNTAEFFEKQKKLGRYVVRIVDPHLPVNLEHTAYKEAKNLDYFIKNSSKSDAIAPCWPGDSSWPDFFRNEVRNWWATQFSYERGDWADNVFVWNDMNEIAVFDRIEGTNHKDWLHMNNSVESREVHSAYGLFMTSGTYKGLLDRNNSKVRPFLLTRSFFSGSQKFAWHWSGDNADTYEHLQLSIDMLISSNMNGLPFTGSDVGGFTGNVTDELHARWFQAGAALYPFFRQHAAINVNYREPYLYKNSKPNIYKTMLESTKTRYRLLPLWYTAAYHHTIDGSPVVAPLWYRYNSQNEFHDVRFQAIIDDRIMVTPLVIENTTSVNVTKPPGKWYQLFKGRVLIDNYTSIESSLGEPAPMFIRAGSIVPIFIESSTTIKDQLTKDIELHIALNENVKASGDLYLDDGTSFEYKNGAYNLVNFEFSINVLTIKVSNKLGSISNRIKRLMIYGATNYKSIKIGDRSYDPSTGILTITGIDADINENKIIDSSKMRSGVTVVITLSTIIVILVIILLLTFLFRKKNVIARLEHTDYTNLP